MYRLHHSFPVLIFFVILRPNKISGSMDDFLLRDWAFLTSHDAATGYMAGLDLVTSVAKTQTSDFAGQLNCGIRCLDLRPAINATGAVVMAHGIVAIPTYLSKALSDVIQWAAQNPLELVLLYVNSCSVFVSSSVNSASCLQSAFADTFSAAGISLVTNCTYLNSLTVKNALLTSTAPGGGHILAFSGCVSENYVETITCYSPSPRVPCYGASTDGAAMATLEKYMNTTAAAAAASPSGLWMAQVWTAAGVAMHTACGPSRHRLRVSPAHRHHFLRPARRRTGSTTQTRCWPRSGHRRRCCETQSSPAPTRARRRSPRRCRR